MAVRFLKSARAAVRRFAARQFLDRIPPGKPFLAVGHNRHPADRLCHDAAEQRKVRGGDRGGVRGGALLGAHRYGFFVLAERLAKPELAARGLRALPPAARLAIVVRLVHEARRATRLGRFEQVAEGPGLASRLARTFGELRLAGVEAGSVAVEDADLGPLYAAYLAALAEARLADRATTFEAARRRLEAAGAEPQAPPPAGLPTVFLDVPLHDRSARRFAGALLSAAPEGLWTLPEGDAETEAALWSLGAVPAEAGGNDGVGRKIPVESSSEFRGTDAVAVAQTHLFAPERPDPAVERAGITVIAAPGTAAEALETARAFLVEAAKGVPFDGMAVLLPDPANQALAFREAFERAGVPAFFEAGARRRHPAGRAFLALLDCALDGLSASGFAEYLSLGETPAGGAPRTDAASGEAAASGFVAPRRWERLILDSEVIGGLDRWERRLARFADRLRRDEEREEDETRREQIRARRGDMRRLTETALPILRRLDPLRALRAAWGEWAACFRELAQAALLHPDGVLECLDETAPMSAVDGVTLDEARESLARRLDAVVIRSTGSRYGRVWVGPIESARGLAFEVVATPGLSERAFPRVIREDPMLLDRRRQQLSEELAVRARLGERERLRLRIAVGAATRRLVLSYSSLDLMDGRPRVPSYYLAETLRAGLGRIPTLGEIRRTADEDSAVARGIRAPRDPALALDRREFDLSRIASALGSGGTRGAGGRRTKGAGAFLLADPTLARTLRQEYMRQAWKWQSPDGFLHAGPEAQATLDAHRPGNRSYSATGLESFAACPYQFFLKNLIRLRPVERPEAMVHLDPLTRGSLLHEVFFHLGQRFRQRGLTPLTEQTLGDAFRVLEEVFEEVEAEVRERVAPTIRPVWDDQMDGLRGDLRGFLRRLAGEGRTALANELSFGMGAKQPADPRSRREAALLPGGLRLHGSIDAVERLPDGRLEVTDYKTGRATIEATPKQRILFGGRTLQPLLYALAYEAISGEPVASGRLYYATLRGAYRETTVDSRSQESREVFEKFVLHLDRAVGRGNFPALPNPEVHYAVCDYCDYLPVCGPRPAGHGRTKPKPGCARVLAQVAEVRRLP